MREIHIDHDNVITYLKNYTSSLSYTDIRLLNSSSLKLIRTEPQWAYWGVNNPDVEREENVHFRIGTAIDTMLTSPSDFDKIFHVSTAVRPRGLMSKFIDALPPKLNEYSSKDLYQEAHTISGYKSNISTVIEKFWGSKEHISYYKEKQLSKTKTLLTKDEYDTTMLCKKELLSNPLTRAYFNRSKYEVIFQIPIYFYWQRPEDIILSKGMIDFVAIDHESKEIHVIDLKSTAKPAFNFPSSFLTYGYHVQACFYDHAFKELLAGRAVSPTFSSSLIARIKDYTVKAPKFMVVPKIEGKRALMFSLSDEDMGRIWAGTDTFEGVDSLLDRWSFHTQIGEWEFPKEVYQYQAIPLKF